MYKAVELNPKPSKITVTFRTSVTVWEKNKSGYGKAVNKVTITNPDSFMYHTYGKGVITYWAEWFSESVRPLRHFSMVFDTLEIKSIEFEYTDYSIHSA